MRKITRQAGFAHTAVVAAAVAVLAVGGVGYLVVSKNDSKSSDASPTSVSSSASSSSTKSADEKAVKAAAKEHFALVYQKKTAEAYELTCQDFKDLLSYSAFLSQLDAGNYYSIDLSAIEYTSVEVRDNQAKIIGPIGPLQPDTKLEVSLLKKNGNWCVGGYGAKTI